MENTRIINPGIENIDEENIEKSLRPQRLSEYIGQTKVKEEGQRLKKLKEEIKNHQLEIRNYEYEIRRIVNDTDKLKQSWFKRLDEQGVDLNYYYEENEIPENENEEMIEGDDYNNYNNGDEQDFQGEEQQIDQYDDGGDI